MDTKFATVLLTGALFAVQTQWSIAVLAAIGFIISLLWFWQFAMRQKFGAIVSFAFSVFVVVVNFNSPNMATNILAIIAPCLLMRTFYHEKKAEHKSARFGFEGTGSVSK